MQELDGCTLVEVHMIHRRVWTTQKFLFSPCDLSFNSRPVTIQKVGTFNLRIVKVPEA